MRRVLTVLVLITSSVVVTVPAAARGGGTRVRLTSPAFGPGGSIPSGFTCDGENVPPPLRWLRLPTPTVELALTVEDLDGPGHAFVHWVAWGIDPAAPGLPEGVVPAGVHEGRNGTGRQGYLGPCPPAGSEPHRYRFTLYALRRPLSLTPGATIDRLHGAMTGRVVGRAELVGRYAR
jgi:Raf kinase inhibitor-like YbhB/YbcL family protein